jgi:hypothetical protein
MKGLASISDVMIRFKVMEDTYLDDDSRETPSAEQR